MQSELNLHQSESHVVRDAIDKVIVQIYNKRKDKNYKSFLLTGSSAGCGTSYTALNMAIALANAGWRTVLVDCDIRKNMKYKYPDQEIDCGLSDYLLEEKSSTIIKTNFENLDYIPSGTHTESAIRLLCSKRMEELVSTLNEQYDYVIYDFPAIDIVPDAGIMLSMIDAAIVVAAAEETSKPQLDAAKAKVKKFGNKYMGVILNKLDLREYKHYIKDFDYFKEEKLRKRYATKAKTAKKPAASTRTVEDTEKTEEKQANE